MRRVAILVGVALLVTACTAGSQTAASIAPSTSMAVPSPSPTKTPPPAPPTPTGPLPGYLLIADRGNARMLLVDGRKQILWRYPKPNAIPAMPFSFDDDTFFTPDRTGIISNQEDQETIQVIGFPDRRLLWHYGHVNASGSSAGYLMTPDDAYMLPNGTVTVADISNCRVLFIAPDHHVRKQYGTTNSCQHGPPHFLDLPNGDTPMPDGGMLITEINGSWIDRISPTGKLMWAVHAPIGYPSDAQWLGHGKILVADYGVPGHILIMTPKGKVLWEYGPTSGPGELRYPSLALMLPNGLVAVNDDYRHRVVLIDPQTDRIVWQYGHTDVAGSGGGYLFKPDGIDFLPYRVAIAQPAIRRYLVGVLGAAVEARAPGF